MKDLASALTLFAIFVFVGVLVSGALGGEYHDIDSAVAWVSSVTGIA